MKEILIRGVNWLGDAIMTTPALLRLRERFPESHITLITPEKLLGLWESHPSVDDTITFRQTENVWALARRLKDKRFDLGIVLPNSFRSAMELWTADVRERVGYAGHWRRWLLTRPIAPRPKVPRMRKQSVRTIRRLAKSNRSRVPAPEVAHHIHHYLHLAAQVGANPAPLPPHIEVRDSELHSFIAKFNVLPKSGRPLLGLNPGAAYGPAKRWPAERFISAAVQIQRRTQCQWLVFGAKEESEMTIRICSGIRSGLRPASDAGSNERPPLNLAGSTSLRELCAGLKICQVLVTNDSGPMHLAAAVGTPVVALFGSTSPELTGPGITGDPRHSILCGDAACAPCFLRTCPIDFRCMLQISVDQVVEAVLARLQRFEI